MQYDMHYYATYAMAVAAGIPVADAEVIATSAQFVDDQNLASWVLTKSQEGILGIATAHHPLDAGVRTLLTTSESNDTRPVRVPFHFLPGAEGKTFEERMVCRKNSKVANAMLDYYLEPETIAAHRDHALQLIGIAAHVYADTFSHYGFSGLSAEMNQVQIDSIAIDSNHTSIMDHIKRQADAFTSMFSQTAKLGHGAVLTNPDRPYLKWSFTYQHGESSQRNNVDTFLEGCQALYVMFARFASVFYPSTPARRLEWRELAAPVKAILEREGAADQRVGFWMAAMRDGDLSALPVCRAYDADVWMAQTEAFRISENATDFIASNPYRFFVAAEYHRNYVLKRLLPRYELMVA